MKLAIISALLLIGLVSSAPTSKEDDKDDDKLVVTEEFFPEELKIYEAEHDIVKIYVPMNNLNFDDNSSESNEDDDSIIFVVEADEKDGQRVDQGLFVRKDGKTKKLLDDARDVAAPYDDSKVAYFAAKDGLYIYNYEKNEATKFGTIDVELVGIVAGNTSDTLYVLTADKKVYKVSEEGTKKVKIDDIKNAEQIVLDFGNNLFYSDDKNDVYVVNGDGVKKIEGLTENASKVTLIRPPFIMEEGGIPVVVDQKGYSIYPNGTSKYSAIDINVPITAYSMELSLMQYYAYNKKIYEYNILAIILSSALEELKEFLGDKQDSIEQIATRSRSEFLNKA